jgi:hypothetical protein
MSVHTDVEVACDGGGFQFACSESLYARTAAEARRELSQRGWLVGQPGGKDYCPEHHISDGAVTGRG